MSNIFITSDTHFWHTNIIKYCNRPFESVEEMNEKLIENWNSIVNKYDTVYHLGDFCIGGRQQIYDLVHRLKGNIKLIKGNHDSHSNKFFRECGFKEVYDLPILLNNKYLLSHTPINVSDYIINLYGHVHTDSRYDTYTYNSVCMCVERHEYKPVAFEYVNSLYQGGEKQHG